MESGRRWSGRRVFSRNLAEFGKYGEFVYNDVGDQSVSVENTDSYSLFGSPSHILSFPAIMNTHLLLALFTVAAHIGIAVSRATGHQSNEISHQMSSCDLPNICSQHGTCESTTDGPQCICEDGFRGRRCEHFVSKRCHMYSKQHEQLKTCGAGQWCMPDNFYCHFYPCKNSDGWCLPVQGN